MEVHSYRLIDLGLGSKYKLTIKLITKTLKKLGGLTRAQIV